MSETVAVATWTLRQIDQARGLRGRLYVWDDVIRQHEDEVMGATRGELAEALKQMAHPFAIDIHEGDLEFTTWRDETVPFAVRVDCRWNPTTNACEMRGGPRDGEVWANQHPGEPLKFAVLESTPWYAADDTTEADAALTTRTVVYVLAGWSETHRRWVYEVA